VFYLIAGENRKFGIAACPSFIREWMDLEQQKKAA
jgi:hypothetical protein